MTDIKSKAVLGTKDYHEVMQQAAIDALMRQAGYMPKRGVFVDEPKANFILYDTGGIHAEEFHAFAKYVREYGWIAGGSAFHFVHGDIGYGDIDVFCVSVAAYEHLCRVFSGGVYSSGKRSCVIGGVHHYHINRTINLICPPAGVDWTHPVDVLNSFHITPPAVAIIAPGLAYTPFGGDVIGKRINYIGNAKDPLRLWRLVLKYVGRGCKTDANFWDDLIHDDKMRPLVYMAKDLYALGNRAQELITQDCYGAVRAIAWSGAYESSVDDDL